MQRGTLCIRQFARVPLSKIARNEQRQETLLVTGTHTNTLWEIGAVLAGSIVVDMTFLRDENHIVPDPPPSFPSQTGKGTQGNRAQGYWSVIFELVMIVDGRNLRYEARWPVSDTVDAAAHGQSIRAAGQISIAAAFKPGTA
jgi:hypothetical protein